MKAEPNRAPLILLVNPWIVDFAAYDLWAKPLGLLHLASLLREGGCGVAFIDCTHRHDGSSTRHPELIPGVDRRFGTGKYARVPIPKPEALSEIPRRYYRYGIHRDRLLERLKDLERPDLIWVTSLMTYWYPGVQETIRAVRHVFPDVPVWLGGVYAKLCPEHAGRFSGADEVVNDPPALLPLKIEAQTGYPLRNPTRWMHFRDWPAPALDLLGPLRYAPLLTSTGCRFRCPYCASGLLQPSWERRASESIFEEVLNRHETDGVTDFAFYDDALLLDAETSLKPALERVVKAALPVRFHTPNALHVRALTLDWCRLLKESGFTTLRLGLETTRPGRLREWGGKVDLASFYEALENLVTAGFDSRQIGVYLLAGVPGQTPEEVKEAIEVVRQAGALPYLAEYSPIPGTLMWPEAARISRFDLASEPLYHNNTFFACRRPGFEYQDLQDLKRMALDARRHQDPQRVPRP